jgi:hypothetical protein
MYPVLCNCLTPANYAGHVSSNVTDIDFFWPIFLLRKGI